jgi:hypothetical protein
LYLYSKKDSNTHQKLLILNPGVFVKLQSPQTIYPEIQAKDQKSHKIYPIELFLGGSQTNIGIEPVSLS